MNVALTPPSLEYEGVIQQCAGDSRVAATCNIPEPYPSDGALKWLRRVGEAMAERRSAVFLVLADGRFAGVMSLNRIDWCAGACELDYWIAAHCQGLGIGSEAVRLVLDEARDSLGLRSVIGTCLADNEKSIRVLEKNGFSWLDRLVNDGRYGPKFLGREMRRFRKEIVVWTGGKG